MLTTKSLLAAAALTLAAAAPAAADSIAYVQGGDVRLTTTDFARQFQVTATGDYVTASQADDGTLLATTKGGHVRKLDRQGAVLSDISTLGTGCTGSFCFKGPFDADVSPNGQKAAWGFYYDGYTTSPSGTYVNEGNATAFSQVDRDTESDTGFKSSREYDEPEWLDDSTVLLSNGPGSPSNPIAVAVAGSGDSRSWFTDPRNTHPQDATMSRSRKVMAAVDGTRRSISTYRIPSGKLLDEVFSCYELSDETGDFRYSSPTLNADGSKLVWASGHGLYWAALPDQSTGCPDLAKGGTEVLPGASSPDWGPADVPAARQLPVPAPAPAPAPAPVPAPTPSAGLQVAASSAKLKAALRKGVAVRVTAARAGKVSVTAARGAKVVAKGTAQAKAAGPVTVKLSFTKAGAKLVRKARGGALTVTASQGAETATTGLTLKR